jgi:CheY-like chemotaxis protein
VLREQPPRAPDHGKTIAILEDDAELLRLMKELLESENGNRVETCQEGEEAYRFVKDTQPDLVILDLKFPGQALGWTILERLKADPETGPIPVAVCSAASNALHEREDLLNAGDVRAISKPFEIEDLLNTARRATRGDR